MTKNNQSKEIFIRRIIMTVAGVLGGGACVGLFRMSVFGVDPFQALMSGISEAFPNLSFGMLNVIINAALLLIALLMDRSKIGLGTFINLFLLGYVIDFSHQTLMTMFPTVTLWGRLLFFIVGVVIICLASALYFTADMGVSTYDAVALILADRQPKLSFKYWRVITDSICVLIGASLFLLAGNRFNQIFTIIGIGTIIAAFFMGPLIAFFNKHVAQPVLKIKDSQ